MLSAKLMFDLYSYTYGDVVIFRCEPGYMLTGRDFAVCGLDGRWDSPAADCELFEDREHGRG